MITWTDLVPFAGFARARAGLPLMGLLALHRQRNDLALLDDRMLADIGLTRDEAETEANRPMWDVPDHWRR